ncbi:RNA polymerase sigma factor [Streptomyces sp. NPDC015532]|uniref:RNA polymerase sigma factor n=1 Tax=Streptomyces sp. NPDC015532 TaxID=3364960 RepID=UPI0036F7E1A2
MHSPALSGVQVPADRWELLLPHRERIHRLARSRLSGDQEAEDCAQEALIRAATFRDLDESRVGPFLTTVTLRLCTDIHRRDERARRLLRGPWAEVMASPEELICAAQEEAWALEQVDRLAGREHQVIVARLNGISTREFASRRGISLKAAESAFTKARARLRRWYEEALTG